MKKVLGVFVGFLMITIFVFIVPVQAKEIEHKTITDLNKSWTINFNKTIDNNTISSSSIYIRDSHGKIIKSTLKTYDSASKVTILPNEKYIIGEIYTLYITKSIKDKNGVNLNEETHMDFDVKTSIKEDENLEVENDLSYLDSIFSLNRNQIYDKFGKPISTGYYEVEYLKYKNMIIFLSEEKVSSIWFYGNKEMFGVALERDTNYIKSKLGEPISELDKDQNEATREHILSYEIGNYEVDFIGEDIYEKHFLQVSKKDTYNY